MAEWKVELMAYGKDWNEVGMKVENSAAWMEIFVDESRALNSAGELAVKMVDETADRMVALMEV